MRSTARGGNAPPPFFLRRAKYRTAGAGLGVRKPMSTGGHLNDVGGAAFAEDADLAALPIELQVPAPARPPEECSCRSTELT